MPSPPSIHAVQSTKAIASATINALRARREWNPVWSAEAEAMRAVRWGVGKAYPTPDERCAALRG
jgi:hypothetical protein